MNVEMCNGKAILWVSKHCQSGSYNLEIQEKGHWVLPIGRARRLTPLECERLMGFPDGYTAGFSDHQRYKMLGNSMAVPVVRWIGERILREEERNE